MHGHPCTTRASTHYWASVWGCIGASSGVVPLQVDMCAQIEFDQGWLDLLSNDLDNDVALVPKRLVNHGSFLGLSWVTSESIMGHFWVCLKTDGECSGPESTIGLPMGTRHPIGAGHRRGPVDIEGFKVY